MTKKKGLPMASHDLLAPLVPPTMPPQKSRLLIVDDESSVLQALHETLRKLGYETQECTSGAEALVALQSTEFDVLLCDIMMAGMDGIALLRAAHEIAPDVVGVLMTGKSSVESAVAALRAGAFDYVTKPLNLSTLLPVLTRALEFRRLRTENVQLREIVTVYELSTAMAFSLDSETILRKTAEAVLQACQADEVTIVLPIPGGNEWYVAMALGEKQEPLIGQTVSLEQSIVGWVVRHREPLVLQGGIQDPRFMSVMPRTDIRSALTIPLVTGGRLVGVMNINAIKRQYAFTLADQKAASIVASMAAPALVNTRLYQELEIRVQERTAELTSTNEALRREVAERQRAEAAVRREEEYFRSLTENALDLVALCDAKGLTRYISPSVHTMLGYQPDELTGRSHLLFIHPDARSRVQEEFARLLETPGSITSIEYQVQHKDGSFRILEAVMHNLLSNPAVGGVVINARDVTERKEALRLKEEMVSVVSHELRSPLTSLRGFTELLLTQQYSGEKQKQMLAIVHKESLRLNNLINDFLDMQRLQSGRMMYHFAAVELNPFLRETIALFAQQGGKHTIRLEVSSSLPPVYADADRIHQVLVNLLSNATKFSPHGGEILVGARSEGAHVRVWVTDHGLGIPRQEIPKLFHKFQRVERKETRGIGGTGLGLALVKQIIEAHHGAVGVESEIGKGSTFFLTLPCVEAKHLLSHNEGEKENRRLSEEAA
jgi:PAS domain S-box-containing protein